MSAAATAYGAAMLDLVERLSELAERYELEPEEWAGKAYCELASTPHLWPLDDLWLEMLLAWAGFDLDDSEDLRRAVTVLALLLATDPDEPTLHCSHGDDPSPLCAIFEQWDLGAVYEVAAARRAEGTFDPVFELRRQRLVQLGVDPDGRPEQA